MTDLMLLIIAAVLMAVLFNLRDRRAARERAERNRVAAERERVEQAWMAEVRAARGRQEASPAAGRRVQKTSEAVNQTARGQKGTQSRTDDRHRSSRPIDPMMDMFSPMNPTSPYYTAAPFGVFTDPSPDRSTCETPAPDTPSSSSSDSSSSCDTSGSSSGGSDW